MNKVGIKIVATGRAVPERIVTNDDLKQYMETDDEWIYSRTGIRERRYCDKAKGENGTGLAIDAAGKALRNAAEMIPGFSKEAIGAVLCTTCSAEYMLPSIASMVQKNLELPQNVLAFDLNAACSGFVFGITTARALMIANGWKYVLLVSTEQLSKQTNLSDRGTGILFADGAGAALLELDETCEFASCAWSDGDASTLYCKGAGTGTVCAEPDGQNGDPLHENQTIYMDGHAVFRFAVSVVPSSINHLLEDSGLSIDEIDYILCHQANARIIDNVKKKYKGQEHKFLMNIERYGNTSSASIPILLDEMLENGTIQKGKKILCVGFGAGLAWGGVIANI